MKHSTKLKVVDTIAVVLVMIGLITIVSMCVPQQVHAKDTIYDETFIMTEISNDIPYNLLKNIANEESRFRYDVINCITRSPKGALGLMQIIPRYHPTVDPCNPEDSIRYAGKYLSELKKITGDWYTATMVYNWGVGNYLKKYPIVPTGVSHYANRVWTKYDPIFMTGEFSYSGSITWD